MDNKTPEEIVLEIQEACKRLGWSIALSDRDIGVQGLIIGNFDYVNEIVEQLANADDFEVWDMPEINLGTH